MADNFFAYLHDGSIRRINLIQRVMPRIHDVFVNNGQALLQDREEVQFDGNYKIDDDEVLFVNMDLPNEFLEVVRNPIGIPILDLRNEKIRSLFWHENNIYYFQNFDNRKLLRNKNIVIYSDNTYDTLEEDAFIIDNTVNAVYKDGKYLFLSYANANKIFTLAEYYKEATDEELAEFGKHKVISLEDSEWFKNNSNTTIRKQVTLLQRSGVLDGADTSKIKGKARKFKLSIDLDKKGKIIFPCEKKTCKEILLFLNEQYFVGLITGNHYKTNSKRSI